MRRWIKRKENQKLMSNRQENSDYTEKKRPKQREDERVDDLQRNGYRIFQKKKGFCFGMDAVLLSGFAWVKRGEQAVDLGTGTGIIPLLLEAKTEGKYFVGLEIQEDMADMAARSVSLNHLEDKIKIIQGDLKEASRIFGKASFDVVTANPPYIVKQQGLKNPDIPKAISRHEILCTWEDVAREAGLLLRTGGRFYLVHRPRRLAEIIYILKQYKLEPKRIKMVHPYVDKEANMVLIQAVKGGGQMLKVEPPLIVFKEPGVYSEEITSVYGY